MDHLFDEQVKDGPELAFSVGGVGRIDSQDIHQAAGSPESHVLKTSSSRCGYASIPKHTEANKHRGPRKEVKNAT